jgi:hypothetical protein
MATAEAFRSSTTRAVGSGTVAVIVAARDVASTIVVAGGCGC